MNVNSVGHTRWLLRRPRLKVRQLKHSLAFAFISGEPGFISLSRKGRVYKIQDMVMLTLKLVYMVYCKGHRRYGRERDGVLHEGRNPSRYEEGLGRASDISGRLSSFRIFLALFIAPFPLKTFSMKYSPAY